MAMMSTIKSTGPVNTGSVAPFLPMLWQQTWSEFLMLLRTPSFSIIGLVLPVILFEFVGLDSGYGHSKLNGVNISTYVLASYATYGVVYVMLYLFGVKVALERGQRLNVLMRATPLPPVVYVLSKVLTALAFTLLMLLLLAGFATIVAGVHLAVGIWLALIARLLLGAVPFIALGIAIGYGASPTAAASINSIAFLLLSFASGIFVPVNQLPDFMQRLAPYLPMYRLAELGWNAVGAQTTSPGNDVLWLLLYGLAFAFVAMLAFRREQQQTFG